MKYNSSKELQSMVVKYQDEYPNGTLHSVPMYLLHQALQYLVKNIATIFEIQKDSKLLEDIFKLLADQTIFIERLDMDFLKILGISSLDHLKDQSKELYNAFKSIYLLTLSIEGNQEFYKKMFPDTLKDEKLDIQEYMKLVMSIVYRHTAHLANELSIENGNYGFIVSPQESHLDLSRLLNY